MSSFMDHGSGDCAGIVNLRWWLEGVFLPIVGFCGIIGEMYDSLISNSQFFLIDWYTLFRNHFMTTVSCVYER